jgi:hypothetical protein
MKLIDLQKQVATVTSAATITLGAAVAPFRTVATAIAAGHAAIGESGFSFYVLNPATGAYQVSLYTITDATTLTLESILGSSNSNAAVAFGGASCEVYSSAPATLLNGTPLADYLAANDAGTPTGTDVLALARGSGLLGVTLSALALAINKLWPTATAATLEITATAVFPLDFTTHHRRRVVCTATPAKITAPSSFSQVGNGFECKVHNVSGADITLEGITVYPSGSVIPNGAQAEIYAAGGALRAVLQGVSSASVVVAPGQVTGLTAGTSTDTTQPLTWTAPSTGGTPSAYKVERSTDSTNWTTASSTVTGTSYTVPGLSASTTYIYRVTATNAGGPGPASATVTKSTAASGSASSPFTVENDTSFPTAMGTGQSDFLWTRIRQVAGATVTVASVTGALSTSNTVPPTSGIGQGTAPSGNWLGDLQNYSPPSVNYIVPSSSGIPYSAAALNYYFWLFVTDSTGKVWIFVRPLAVNIGNGVTKAQSGSLTLMTLVP